MEFQIRRNVLDDRCILAITEARFNSIKKSHDLLFRSLAREQKYDIVVRNYLDLEKEIFAWSIDQVVRSGFKRSDSDQATVSIDRAVTNFLSSTRAFIDHSQRNLESQDLSSIRGFYAAQYDASLAYRTMEALRNYSQHSGFCYPCAELSGKLDRIGRRGAQANPYPRPLPQD